MSSYVFGQLPESGVSRCLPIGRNGNMYWRTLAVTVCAIVGLLAFEGSRDTHPSIDIRVWGSFVHVSRSINVQLQHEKTLPATLTRGGSRRCHVGVSPSLSGGG